MSAKKDPRERAIQILVALFVVIFAAILFVRYSPWGSPEPRYWDTPEVERTQAALPLAYDGEMPLIELELASGTVTIQMRPDLAPKHVAQIVELTNQGFYDGIVFHRVIDGFMAQTGDPTGTGMGGSDLPDIAAEFTDTPFVRGIVGMARSQSPDSANSQFFIVYDDAGFLNGQYTVIGEVIEGMEYVDEIKKGSERANGQVDDPDSIISMRVVDAI